jgi:hypothetical protein
MTLSKLDLASGLVKDDTPLAAEGTWIDAQNVRFRQGKPELHGGHELLSTSNFGGIARGSIAWTDLAGNPQLAYGTANKLFAYSGGADLDITPNHTEEALADLAPYSAEKTANYTIVAADKNKILLVPHTSAGGFTFSLSAHGTIGATADTPIFIRNYGTGSVTVAPNGADTINGVNASITIAANTAIAIACDGTAFTTFDVAKEGPFSTVDTTATVTVYKVEHGLSVGQSITFTNAPTVGGVTINGTYTVASIVNRNHFTFTASGNATSTTTGGFADMVAAFTSGLVDGTGGAGFGTGTFGTGAWGVPSTSDFLPSCWSLSNFGENLLAVRRGGGLYCWQPQTAYTDIILAGDMSDATKWAAGTNWAVSAGVATKTVTTASDLSQNIQNAAIDGYVYRVNFTVVVTTGAVKLQINAGIDPAPIDVGAASAWITQSGTYSRLVLLPSNTVDLVFAADAAFAGTIDNVSMKVENIAFRVVEAPVRIESMFVDPNRFVVLLGTMDANGTFNPLLARWSDQENFRSYVPSAENLAGEYPLSNGGRLVGGLPSRQQNLIWSNAGMYVMQFTGDSTSVFSFNLIGTGCGLIGQNAAAEHNGIAFWLSNNGNFYIFQGSVPQIIDCRLRKDVFDHIAAGQGEKIFCGINAQFSEVRWFTPDTRDGPNGDDGIECSRYADFNWIENHWSAGKSSITSWAPAGIFTYPIGFWSTGNIYYHERGNTANGAALTAFLESAYFDIEDGAKFVAVMRIVAEFAAQQGNVGVTLYFKNFPRDTERSFGPKVFTPTTSSKGVRRTGRQMKIRFDSSDAPSFWRLGLLRLDVEKTDMSR